MRATRMPIAASVPMVRDPEIAELPADPVDRSSADRADERERDHDDPAVHRGADTDGTDAIGSSRELVELGLGPTEQLDQQRAGDVEPLGHLRVHRRVEVHRLTGDRL